MRVRVQGELMCADPPMVIIIMFLSVCLSVHQLQFRRLQTELVDEFGDDVKVVSLCCVCVCVCVCVRVCVCVLCVCVCHCVCVTVCVDR